MRSQSAMEYLMTYGWAILAIAIVMVSLYSLGIFNTGSLQPTATPGSCEVVRTAAQTSLAGQCSNLIPKYVADTNSTSASHIKAVSAKLKITNNVTVVGWFYYKGAESEGCISPATVGTGGCSSEIYGVGQDDNVGSDKNKWQAVAASSNGTFCWHDFVVPVAGWQQVAAEYNSGTGKTTLFLNGVNESSVACFTAGTQLSTYSTLNIGGLGSASTWFNGRVSNIQVYNTSLDGTSIKALYQEGIGGTPIDIQHLVGWWPLNGNANDYSGNNANSTAYSIVWNANWQSGYSSPTT